MFYVSLSLKWKWLLKAYINCEPIILSIIFEWAHIVCLAVTRIINLLTARLTSLKVLKTTKSSRAIKDCIRVNDAWHGTSKLLNSRNKTLELWKSSLWNTNQSYKTASCKTTIKLTKLLFVKYTITVCLRICSTADC